MSITDLSPMGLTVTRSAGACGLLVGEKALLVPGGGPGGGMSADEGGTEMQRGGPSEPGLGVADEGGTVEGGRGPKG